MSTDLNEIPQDAGSKEGLILLRNIARDPLKIIVNSCHMLLSQELGDMSEDQNKFVNQILEQAEFIVKEMDSYLASQGIVFGPPPKEVEPNDS